MLRRYLARFAVPGTLPERAVFIVSMFAICAVFWADVATTADVRFRVVYIFPLTAIALHSEQMRKVVIGFILTVFCEIVSLLLYHLSLAATLLEGFLGITGFLLVIVLARATRENYLRTLQLATHDPLTKLRNRQSFGLVAEAELERQKRYGGVFSLAVIDLDGFKKLNDSQGHHAGDLALLLLADILRNHTRHSDATARLGGDEFAILMPLTHSADCAALCQQLASTIALRMQERGFSITASIGHATFDQAPQTVLDALRIADHAMYAAKANRRGRVASD